jgi:glyoxylase-like metal-dependent hydrolase (beta-lactamase superfamily II)
MGWSTTVITPPDGDMTDYLASLARIRARNFDVLWPTHGPPIRDVDAFIDAYADHRQERIDQITDGAEGRPGEDPRPGAEALRRRGRAPAPGRGALDAGGDDPPGARGRAGDDGAPGPDSEYRLV